MLSQVRVRDVAVGAMLIGLGLIAGLTVRPTETHAQSPACQVSAGGASSAYLVCGDRVLVCQGNRCGPVVFN